MFKNAVIHYPTSDYSMKQINKELAVFRRNATIRYIESLNLNDKQIETLFTSMLNDITPSQACL